MALSLKQRMGMQARLEETLQSKNVYFQPPASVKMEYPCIRYRYADIDSTFANNRPYITRPRFEVIYISRTMDEEMLEKLSSFPKCLCDRSYTAENLYHTVFTIYL